MTHDTPLPPSHPLAATETTDTRYLDSKMLRFFRHGAALRLTDGEEASYLRVTVARLFPLSEPERYLSVRDGANKEVGILTELAALDADSRVLVEQELERRYLAPVVRRVVSARERFGTVDWAVETDRGARTFTTRNLRDNLLQPSPERYLLTDIDGNRYDIRDLSALDAASQSLLMPHL